MQKRQLCCCKQEGFNSLPSKAPFLTLAILQVNDFIFRDEKSVQKAAMQRELDGNTFRS